MTDNTHSKVSSAEPPLEHPAFQAMRERIDAAAERLLAMPRYELVDVLLKVFDAVRLDENGNPNRPHGLYEAAVTAMIALVDGPAEEPELPGVRITNPDQIAANRGHDELAARLAAVGRGARLQQKDQDFVEKIREIAPLIESIRTSASIPQADKAAMLTTTLEKRFGSPIATAEVEAALKARSLNGRVTKVAMAAGFLPATSNSVDYTAAIHRIRDALK